MSPTIKPLILMVSQHPLRPSACGFLMRVDHVPFPLGTDAVTMVHLADSLLTSVSYRALLFEKGPGTISTIPVNFIPWLNTSNKARFQFT